MLASRRAQARKLSCVSLILIPPPPRINSEKGKKPNTPTHAAPLPLALAQQARDARERGALTLSGSAALVARGRQGLAKVFARLSELPAYVRGL